MPDPYRIVTCPTLPVLEAALEGGATAGQAERLRALASPLSGG